VQLDAVEEQMQREGTAEAVVFSKVYKAMAEYRKSVGPPADFYKTALQYLAYTPPTQIPAEERYALATDMALAALTGEGVYNFGEVIATPVLAELTDSPNQYLRDLVIALNQGNIDVFNAVIDSNREVYFAQEVLKNCHEQIQQKVVLLSLMNVVFELPSHERNISFATIANESRVPIEQVDWILMRAMSLGLIRGTIDEVAQAVSVTWVQPRVLDTKEVATLSLQLADWVERVKGTLVGVEEQTLELYV
jgi:26S proteasome regulatory subunit N9